MTSDCSGKVVVVTGASHGIGAAATLALASAGATVFALSRSGAAPASAENVVPLACDVSDAAAVAAAFERVREAGGPDVLINNAGTIEPIGHITEVDPDAWWQLQRVNLYGLYLCVRAALPAMIAKGGGTIINISSGAAHRALEGWSAYCTSKAATAMLTRCIHEEYSGSGITCVGFRPGLVDTGMQSLIRDSGMNPVSRIPRDTLLPPGQVAQVLVWLASGAAGERAGTEVNIDDPEVRREAGLPSPGGEP